MLALIMNRFEEFFSIFSQQGFIPFLELYYQYWFHSNEKVKLETEEGTIEVVIQGITPSGFLDAKDAHSEKYYELHPDGNSFDLMRGLIHKKISKV